MPPAGRMPVIGPIPTLNTISRIMPSQNVGSDHRVSATPELTLSNSRPGRQPLCAPIHRPSSSESTNEVPISSSVGPMWSSTSEATDCLYSHE